MYPSLPCRCPRRFLLGVVLGIVIGWSWLEHGDHHVATYAQDSQQRPADAALAERLTMVEQRLPSQSHAMADVDYHFSNLYFAAKAENWPLAAFYWKETRSHLEWAVRIIPIRKDLAGDEIRLKDILQSIEQSPWMQIGKTIEAKDFTQFEKSYRYTVEGCYSCHKACGKPYLRPRLPEKPASTLINFDPSAAWPE